MRYGFFHGIAAAGLGLVLSSLVAPSAKAAETSLEISLAVVTFKTETPAGTVTAFFEKTTATEEELEVLTPRIAKKLDLVFNFPQGIQLRVPCTEIWKTKAYRAFAKKEELRGYTQSAGIVEIEMHAKEIHEEVLSMHFGTHFKALIPGKTLDIENTGTEIIVAQKNTKEDLNLVYTSFSPAALGEPDLNNISEWLSKAATVTDSGPFVLWYQDRAKTRSITSFRDMSQHKTEYNSHSPVHMLAAIKELREDLESFAKDPHIALSDSPRFKKYLATLQKAISQRNSGTEKYSTATQIDPDKPISHFKYKHSSFDILAKQAHPLAVGDFHVRFTLAPHLEFLYDESKPLKDQIEAAKRGRLPHMLTVKSKNLKQVSEEPTVQETVTIHVFSASGQKIIFKEVPTNNTFLIERIRWFVDALNKWPNVYQALQRLVENTPSTDKSLENFGQVYSQDEEISFTLKANELEIQRYDGKKRHFKFTNEQGKSIWEDLRKKIDEQIEEVRSSPDFLLARVQGFGLALKQHIFALPVDEQSAWKQTLEEFAEIEKTTNALVSQNAVMNFLFLNRQIKKLRHRLSALENTGIKPSNPFFNPSHYITLVTTQAFPELEKSRDALYQLFSKLLANGVRLKQNFRDPENNVKYLVSAQAGSNNTISVGLESQLELLSEMGSKYINIPRDSAQTQTAFMAWLEKLLLADNQELQRKQLQTTGYRQNAFGGDDCKKQLSAGEAEKAKPKRTKDE